MDLKSLNPKLFEVWDFCKDLPEDFFKWSSKEDIQALVDYTDGKLPDDIRIFLEKYGMLPGAMKYGVQYFKCEFRSGNVITHEHTLIPNAQHFLHSTKSAQTGPAYDSGIGSRIPESFLSTDFARGNGAFLFDMRDKTLGQVHFLKSLKHQAFGTSGYDWGNIGFVADSFTNFLRAIGTKEDLKEKYPDLEVV